MSLEGVNMSGFNITDSILDTIKLKLGITSDYNAFDTDIITCINSALRYANQLGVGNEGFRISDNTSKWNEFISEEENIDEVIDYIYLRVRILFDPPSSSYVLDSYKEAIKEMEWRMNVQEESLNTQ